MNLPPWRAIRRRLLFLGAACVLVGLGAGFWAAGRITARFEARESESASLLLGRPYPLASGTPGTARDLAHRLERLGYRRLRGEPAEPGTYAARGDLVRAHLRAFRDASGDHPPQVVRVEFDGTRILSVDRPGAALEPETIALLQGRDLEERERVDAARCPKHLIDAVLAAEDRRFFLHPGIDPAGVLRAAWTNVTSRSLLQGGSTLTQQLAKNLYFSGERTLTRKAGEAFAAVLLEALYSKDRILRAYLNEIYLGQRGAASVRGVARAARHYFDKDVSDLTLAESALLAGMIRAPGLYNPFLHADRARERRDAVLRAMVETGAITEARRAEAAREPLRVTRPPRGSSGARASYVAELLRQDLDAANGPDLSRRGLKVYTSIDPVYQEAAENALRAGLRQLERSYRRLRRGRDGKPLQAALISVDLADGGIVAMVGGRDFAASQFNRATSARRQPGSLFKPVVYLAGLTGPASPGSGPPSPGNRPPPPGRRHEDVLVRGPRSPDWRFARRDPDEDRPVRKRRRWWWWQREEDEEPAPVAEGYVPGLPLTAATLLLDEPYEVKAGGKIWAPRNDDDDFRGPVTVQRAIEESLNVPTARAAAAVGLDRIVTTARALGIRSPMPEVPSLALGAAEATPIEMATAFATIASEGRRRDLVLLRAVEDAAGSVTVPDVGLPGAPRSGGGSEREAAAPSGSADGGGQAIPREAALVMTALLEGVLDSGTGRSARDLGFSGIAAGKTGTSDGGRDLWFCGYTPRILTLVWVGFDDATPTRLSGARAALPIWVDYMGRIGADVEEGFRGDEEIAWVSIDPASGGLARSRCPESRWAPFIPGTEPTEACSLHRSFWSRIFGR